MEQPAPTLQCPDCQQANAPSAVACQTCGAPLKVSLAVTRPASAEAAEAIAGLLAGGNQELEERIEARLIKGRGLLLKEISPSEARWCQEQAEKLGVKLEIRRWRVVTSPPKAPPPPWSSRPSTGVLVVGLLALALLGMRYLYDLATAPPPDAGIRWRSATVKPGRIAPSALDLDPASRPPEPDTDEVGSLKLIEAAKPAVVRVSLKDGIGTGFFVSRDGLIVTNYHVIASGGPITITTVDQQRAEAHVIRRAPAWDLALLKVDAIQPPLVLPLADGSKAQMHAAVHIIGSAEGHDSSARDGHIASVKRTIDAVSLLELDLSAARGNSGSPVLDSAGRVIGVINAILVDSERTSYAILSNYLFDGPDALLRNQARVYPLSNNFLELQLRALANVGDRLLPYGSVTSSQAFVTDRGQLAVMVEAYASSVELTGQQVDLEVWVRNRNGTELVSRSLRAHTSSGADAGLQPAENRAVYFVLQLTPTEERALREAGQATVEVQCEPLKLRNFLPLQAS